MQNKNTIGFVVTVIAILIVGTVLLITHNNTSQTQNTPSLPTNVNPTQVSTSTNPVVINTKIQTVSPPTLSDSVVISPSVPADKAAALTAHETSLITQLKKNPTQYDLWLQLGIDRKSAGDYAGAETAWKYVGKAAPSNLSYIAYGNLGDVYMNFDKNYTAAETNYKVAIAIKPSVIDYYRELYTLYRYQLGSNTKAAAIVAAGLKANPGNPDLLKLQSDLKNS